MTTAARKNSKLGNTVNAEKIIAVKPAAGPVTLKCERLPKPTTIPPTTPAVIPLINGALDANAIPRQSGNATRKTTKEAVKSFGKCFK